MAGVADIALAEATLADIEAIVGDDFECMASDGEDWMIVGRKGRGVRRSSTSHADDDELRPSSMQSSVTNDGAGHHFPTISKQPMEPSCNALLQSVERAFTDVRTSRFYRNCLSALHSVEAAMQEQLAPDWSLHNIESLVVYGLGSLAGYQGINARHQLALAMLLRQTLPGVLSPPEAFDPVFTDVDRHVLSCLDVHVVAHNERGRRVARGPTVFYLPHCEAELTDALLEANWHAGQLHNVIIIGNSFGKYADRWSLPVANHSGLYRPSRMLALCNAPQGCLVEVSMFDAGFPVAAAFNDLSVHVFPQWSPELDDAL